MSYIIPPDDAPIARMKLENPELWTPEPADAVEHARFMQALGEYALDALDPMPLTPTQRLLLDIYGKHHDRDCPCTELDEVTPDELLEQARLESLRDAYQQT